MDVEKKSLIGSGRFQWNAGAWFGSALGCCAWMLVLSAMLAIHGQPGLALLPLSAFTLLVAVAIQLWRRRDRVFPFTALMVFLILLAVLLPLVWIVVAGQARATTLQEMGWPTGTGIKVGVFLMAPGLICWLLLLERFADPNGKLNSTNVSGEIL